MSQQDPRFDVNLLKVIQKLIGVVVVLIAGIIIFLFISVFQIDLQSMLRRNIV